MFKSIFKALSGSSATVEPTRVQKPKFTVAEIHEAFNTGGNAALKEAMEILDQSQKPDQDELAEILKKTGFYSTEMVQDYSERQSKAKKANREMEALQYFQKKYPLYKFITKDVLIRICEKYGLVYGDVALFKEEVPEKNIREIGAFKIKDERAVVFFDAFRGESETDVTVDWVNNNKGGVTLHGAYAVKSFQIAAPFSYFKIEKEQPFLIKECEIVTSGIDLFMLRRRIEGAKERGEPIPTDILKQTQGRAADFVFPVDDPIVLCPLTCNGLRLYAVVTAWGEEAGDAEIVNPVNN